MRFFFDRSAPIAVARMVRAVEDTKYRIVHLDEEKDRFKHDMDDPTWLKILAADGDPPWIVIIGDGRILKNPVNSAALREVGLPFFCLDKTWPKTPIYEYAWKFMRVWPKIIEAARVQKKQSKFMVRGGSSFTVEEI